MGFTSENTALWHPILQLGLLAVILVLANLLQRKVPFVRKLLLPTSVLGGFLALLLRGLGLITVDTDFMESVTYHTIALGFIALGLRMPRHSENPAGQRDGLRSGLLIVDSYLMQGALGMLITAVLAATISPGLFKAAGILLPMGYGQGPGQANNVGSTYEAAYGFTGGSSFGLAIATMGFLWACIGGVIYMNILIRKGKLRLGKLSEKQITVGNFQDEGEIPMSEPVDRLTMQGALVLLVYLATYGVSLGVTAGLSAIPALGGMADNLNALLWGFNFIIGSLLALALRNVFSGLRKAGVMKRQYTNNYLLNRISGMIFDVMIIAGVSSINIDDLRGLWAPFLLMTTLGGIVTLFYLRWICKKLYPRYYHEAFFSMYGMLTGTVSTGILLLREIDPNYKTPATSNLVSGSSYGILFGFPMLIFVGLAARSDFWFWLTFGIIVVYGLILLGAMLWIAKRTPADDSPLESSEDYADSVGGG